MKTIDGARIREAIRAAEEGTSGCIAVHVTPKRVPDPLEHARATFHLAGLHEHPDANAVLFVVAPKSRKFAVYAGDAIHARLGDEFWKHIVNLMTPLFAAGRPTDGLVAAIERIGSELRVHFGTGVTV